jgi:hypothetical protein
MNIQKQIEEHIATQSEPKRSEMQQLHYMILALMPACKLWYLDGKDEKGKTVSNPNIGYGSQITQYANGKTQGVLPNRYQCEYNRDFRLHHGNS